MRDFHQIGTIGSTCVVRFVHGSSSSEVFGRLGDSVETTDNNRPPYDNCITRHWHSIPLCKCDFEELSSQIQYLLYLISWVRISEMLVVWECERLCVVFQLSTKQGFPQNIPEVPQSDLAGHPSRCADSPAHHWLWWFYWLSCPQLPSWDTFKRLPACHTASRVQNRRIDVYERPVWCRWSLQFIPEY